MLPSAGFQPGAFATRAPNPRLDRLPALPHIEISAPTLDHGRPANDTTSPHRGRRTGESSADSDRNPKDASHSAGVTPLNPANLLRKIPALCRGDLATLYGVTIANSLLPLVTVPYLARVLGPGAWGMVLFAQTVAVWPAILMEFGFVYSATRDIARHADDPGKVREIVGEVMVCKFALSILGAASGVLFWLCVPEFRRQPIFLIGAMWIAIVQGFNPLQRLAPKDFLPHSLRRKKLRCRIALTRECMSAA